MGEKTIQVKLNKTFNDRWVLSCNPGKDTSGRQVSLEMEITKGKSQDNCIYVVTKEIHKGYPELEVFRYISNDEYDSNIKALSDYKQYLKDGGSPRNFAPHKTVPPIRDSGYENEFIEMAEKWKALNKLVTFSDTRRM
ncbi:MAG TPA: hypothetical protein HA257_07760 [Candidatus Methanoperedenaceae archaeon]|nr:hypothetical protein [Candidatus Methanoperedenaceae archaeon]